MSADRDYRQELEEGFAQLFGEAFRGLSLDVQRDMDWVYSITGGPPNPVTLNERYILTIHVMYDIEFPVELDRTQPRWQPTYSMKQFVIGNNHPGKLEHQHMHKVANYGSHFVVRAEYVTQDLNQFLDDLREVAKKAYDERFYEAMDKVIKAEET